MTVRHLWIPLGMSFLLANLILFAQGFRPMSPDGIASVHVRGRWEKTEQQQYTLGGERYAGGAWLDITYGRPLLRGRDAFTGTGAGFGKATYADAPVWRAGANLSTRLKTPLALVIGGKTVRPGEYSLFIEFQNPKAWTFIVSSWAQAQRFNAPIAEGLFGAFGYTPEKDVTRAPMQVDELPYKVEQLTWEFIDITGDGGRMAVLWDRTMASVPFTFAQ